MEKNLLEMFRGLNATYKSLESRLKAEGFKVRVMQIFRTWEEWTVYPRDFLIRLQNTFLGYATHEDVEGAEEKEDEDLDGVPLDGAALLKGAMLRGIPSDTKVTNSPSRNESDYEDDIDGIPCMFVYTFCF